MDDKTLRQNILDELEFEPSIDAAHIGLAVDNGVVTLTGHVSSYEEKLATERKVVDNLSIAIRSDRVEQEVPSLQCDP